MYRNARLLHLRKVFISPNVMRYGDKTIVLGFTRYSHEKFIGICSESFVTEIPSVCDGHASRGYPAGIDSINTVHVQLLDRLRLLSFRNQLCQL
ncbi:hypothetical protein NPIL_439121 [Nephila pilipes]|uniref:Uncharacterized protein n=1 Tax=Nephila pilipes TaxID=299642 RepID=A0A8X6UHI9_NEPPI|nr:hypothetical protein NPIL_439121 [Nephila pilipes]